MSKVLALALVLGGTSSCGIFKSSSKVSSLDALKEGNIVTVVPPEEEVKDAAPQRPLDDEVKFQLIDTDGSPVGNTPVEFYLLNATGVDQGEITPEKIEKAWDAGLSAIEGSLSYKSDPKAAENADATFSTNISGRFERKDSSSDTKGFVAAKVVAPRDNEQVVIVAARVKESETSVGGMGYYVFQTASVGQASATRFSLAIISENLNIEQTGEPFSIKIRLLKNGDFTAASSDLTLKVETELDTLVDNDILPKGEMKCELKLGECILSGGPFLVHKQGTLTVRVEETSIPIEEVSDQIAVLSSEASDMVISLTPAEDGITKACVGNPLDPSSQVDPCFKMSADESTIPLYPILIDKAGNPIIGTPSSWQVSAGSPLATDFGATQVNLVKELKPKVAGKGLLVIQSRGKYEFEKRIAYEVVPGSPTYYTIETENSNAEQATVPFDVDIKLYDQNDNFATNYSGNLSIDLGFVGASNSPNATAPTANINEAVEFANGLANPSSKMTLAKSGETPILQGVSSLGTFVSDTITVTPGPTTNLKLMDQALGLGIAYDLSSAIGIQTTGQRQFFVAGFDDAENYTSDIDSIWTHDIPLGVLNSDPAVTGTSTLVQPTALGGGTLTATPIGEHASVPPISVDVAFIPDQASKYGIYLTEADTSVMGFSDIINPDGTVKSSFDNQIDAGKDVNILIIALTSNDIVAEGYSDLVTPQNISFVTTSGNSWAGDSPVLPAGSIPCIFDQGICKLSGASYKITDATLPSIITVSDDLGVIVGAHSEFITANLGAAERIIIADSLGGPGNSAAPLSVFDYTADDSVLLAAALVDAGGNYVSDAPGTTTWAGTSTPTGVFNSGFFSSTTGASVTYNPANPVGTGTITATQNPFTQAVTQTLTITHGVLDHATITDSDEDNTFDPGVCFSIKATFQDADNNTILSYSAVNDVTLELINAESGPAVWLAPYFNVSGSRHFNTYTGSMGILAGELDFSGQVCLSDATAVTPQIRLSMPSKLTFPALTNNDGPVGGFSTAVGALDHIHYSYDAGDTGNFSCNLDRLLYYSGTCTAYNVDDPSFSLHAHKHDRGCNYLGNAVGNWTSVNSQFNNMLSNGSASSSVDISNDNATYAYYSLAFAPTDGTPINGDWLYQFNPGAVTNATVVINGNASVKATSNFNLRVTLRDQHNNRAGLGQTRDVSFSYDLNQATLQSPNGTDAYPLAGELDVNGVFFADGTYTSPMSFSLPNAIPSPDLTISISGTPAVADIVTNIDVLAGPGVEGVLLDDPSISGVPITSRNLKAGDDDLYWACAYDAEGNFSVCDATVNSNFTTSGVLNNSMLSAVTGTNTTLTPENVGTGTVTMTPIDVGITPYTTGTITVTNGDIAYFDVWIQGGNTVTAGSSFDLDVTAVDSYGNPVLEFDGSKTVQFQAFSSPQNIENRSHSLASNGNYDFLDGVLQASTPASFTFFNSSANPIIMVRHDENPFSYSGSVMPNVQADTAHHYGFASVPASNYPKADHSSAFSATLQVRDEWGNPLSGGGDSDVTVSIRTTSGAATTGTLQEQTIGLGPFDLSGTGSQALGDLRYDIQGDRKLWADGTSYTTTTGASPTITFAGGAETVASYSISIPGTVTAGLQFPWTITALNNAGDPVTGAASSLNSLTYSITGPNEPPIGPTLNLPTTLAFTNSGIAIPSIELYKVETLGIGAVTITDSQATDNSSYDRNGSNLGSVSVLYGLNKNYEITASTAATTADFNGTFNIDIDVFDDWKNPRPGDPAVNLLPSRLSGSTIDGTFQGPSVSSLNLGLGTLTLNNVWYPVEQNITFALTGISGTVDAGNTDSVNFTATIHTVDRYRVNKGAPTTLTAGNTNVTVDVYAEDAAGNTITNAAVNTALDGQQYTWSGAGTSPGSDAPIYNGGSNTLDFTAGVASSTHSLRDAETLSIGDLTVTDNYTNVSPPLGNRSGDNDVALTIAPATADHYFIEAPDSLSQVAGVGFDIKVTALDPFDNIDTNWVNDTLTFSWVGTTGTPATPNNAGNIQADGLSGLKAFSSGVFETSTNDLKLYNENDGAISISLAGSSIPGPATLPGWSVTHNSTVDYIKVLDGNSESDSEVGAFALSTDDTVRVYSHGYDYWGNYISLKNSNWTAPSVLNGQLSPASTSNYTDISPDAIGTDVITATPTVGTADSTGLVTVNPGAITKIVFINAPINQTTDDCGTLTIQSQDAESNPSPVAGNKTVNLSNTSNGTFYSDSGCSSSITSTTIPNTSSNVTVYYDNHSVESETLTATVPAESWTDAVQGATVTVGQAALIAITSASLNQESGQCGQINYQFQDQYTNPTTLSSGKTINFASNSTTETFHLVAGCASGAVTSEGHSSGSSGGTVYYKDLTVGLPTITISETGLTNANDSAQINPIAFNITGPSTPNMDNTPDVAWQDSTGVATYDVKVDNTSGCPSPERTFNDVAGLSQTVTPALGDGTWYVCVKADGAGANDRDATNNNLTIVIDTVTPTPSFVGLPSNPSNDVNLSVTVTPTGSAETYEFQYDVIASGQTCAGDASYGAFITGSSTINDAMGTDGGKRLCLIARDEAGNTMVTALETTWVNDQTDADSTITTSGAFGPYSTAGATSELAGTSSDATSGVATVDISVQQVTGGNCLNSGKSAFDTACPNWISASGTTSWTLSGINDSAFSNGSYNISSRATDAAGNVESTLGSSSITWDETPPDPTFTINAGDPTNINTTSVNLILSDDTSVAEIRKGNTADCSSESWVAYVSGPIAHTLDGGADGAKTVCLDVRDSLQNPDSATDGIVLDRADPDSAVASSGFAGPLTTGGANTTLSGTSSDVTTSVTDVDISVQQDSGNCLSAVGGTYTVTCPNWIAATGTTSWTLDVVDTTFTDASVYTVSSRATDAALNVEATLGTNTVTWDDSGPVAAANLITPADSAGGADASVDDDTSIYLKWDASTDSGSGFQDYTIHIFSQAACAGGSSDVTGHATTNYNYTGASDNVTYSFQITSYDNVGNSTLSACSSDILIDITNPVAASSLITPADSAGGSDATYDDDTTVYFKWAAGSDSGSGVASYTLKRYDQAACGGSSNDTTGISSATLDQSYVGTTGTTYSFKIVTIDNAGNSTESSCSSNILVDTTAPSVATTLLTPADSAGGADASYDDDTGVFIKWTAATDGDSGLRDYTLKVYAQSSCGGSAQPDVTGITGTSHSYTVSGEGIYSFKLVTFDNAGNQSAESACSTDIHVDTTNPVAASTLITPADSAGGADASYDDDTGIFFKWTAGSDAGSGIASYTLKRYDQASCAGGSNDTTSIGPATLDQSFTGTTGTTYSYKIVTIDNSGNSTESACSTDIMVDTTAPVAASSLITPLDSAGGVDASYDDDTGIFFKWTAATDADSGIASYTLKRFDQAACGGASNDTTGISPATLDQSFTGSTGNTYSFQVIAYDNAGNSTTSACSSDVMIDTTAPAAATTLLTPADSAGGADASYDDDTAIFIKWTAGTDGDSGVDDYTLKVFAQSSCGGSAQPDVTGVSGTSHSYTVSGEGTYSFQLITFDNAGNQSVASACSTDIVVDTTNPVAASSLITPADSAGGADASYDDDTGIFFKWTAATDIGGSGITSYTLKRYDQAACGGASNDSTGLSAATLDQSYTGSTGTTYSYKIVAYDNAGNSTESGCSTDLMIDTTAPGAASALITPADSAGGVDASYDDDTGIFFKWTAGTDGDSGIASYTLKRYDQAACGGASSDTTGISPATLNQSFTGTTGNSYSFKIVTIDNAGNSTESGCSTDLMVDTTAPSAATSLLTPADSAGGADASYDDDTSIYIKWTAGSDADSGIQDYTLKVFAQSSCGGSAQPDVTGVSGTSHNYTVSGEGIYSFQLITIDNAGNQSSASACSTDIEVDTTNPVAANSLITPADSAGGVDASYDDDTGIFFKWIAATDAGGSGIASYTLKRYDQAACGGASSDTTGLSAATLDQSFTGSTGITYSFEIVAYDNAGNSATSSCSTNLMVDTTAPSAATTLLTPADSAGGVDASYDDDTGIFIKWTAGSDGDSGIQDYTLKVFAQSSCGGSAQPDVTGVTGTSHSYTVSGEGTYSFQLVTIDNAGNQSAASACSTDIIVDTTNPVAASSLITPADSAGGADANYDDDTGIFFKWNAGSDAGSGVASYTLKRYDQAACGGASNDTTGISSATLDQSYTGSTGTTYSYRIVVFDNAGNSTESGCSTDMLIDTTAPVVATALVTPADAAGGADAAYDDDTGIFFKWTAGSDADSGLASYTLKRYDQAACGGASSDTTGISTATLNQSYTGSTGNTYSFKIVAVDNAGNTNESACSTDLMIDTTAPVAATTLLTPADSAGGADASYDDDTGIFIKWTAGSDADSGVDDYTLKVFAQSSCGGSAQPDVTGVSGASHSYTVSGEGTYSFQLVTIDNAGNQSAASACSTDIEVDTTNPVAASSLKTPADGAGGADASYDDDTGIFFAWSAATDVGGSGITSYTLKRYDQTACGGASSDTTGLSAATLNQSYTGASGTTYSFKVVAFDNAGNSTESGCSSDMLIDTTAPVAASSLITPADAAGGADASYDNDTGIFFKWTGASDADSGIASYTLKRYDQAACGGASSDTTGISPATTNQSYTGTSGTTYSFKIVAIDNAGNSTESTCSTDLMIDTTNPVAASSLITPADSAGGADASYDNDTGIFFKWTAGSDADSGVASYTLKRYDQAACGGASNDTTGISSATLDQSYTGSTGTSYSYKIVVFDNAGNSTESGCSTDMLIDTTAPVVATALITPADAAGGADAAYDDDTGIFFKWTAGSDADSGLASYTLKRYDQAACGGASSDTTGISTATLNQSYTGSTGNTYSFKIVAVDNAGNTNESACSTDLMIDTTAPAAATTLLTPADSAGGADASYDDDTGIFIKWTAGSDADSGVDDYTLKVFAQSSCGGSAQPDVTGVTGTSHSYTVGGEGTYSFQLITIDNAGNQSAASACSTDIVVDTTDPVAASSLITPADSAGGADASYDDDTGIFFKWSAATDVGGSGIASYTLKRYDQTACGGAASDTTGLSSATLDQSYTGSTGSTYSFKVVAFDNAGNSITSACSTDMLIDTTPPVVATGLITPADSAGGADASYDNDTGIFFKWTAGSDADSGLASYTLKRYDQAACGGASSDTTGISTATLNQSYTGSTGNTYSFKIVAVDNAGNTNESACSSDLMIDTTAPAAATTLLTPADSAGGADASYDDDTGIFIKWTAGSDADSGVDDYTLKVFAQSSCGGSAQPDVTGVTGTSHSYTVSAEGTYSFQLITIDNAGNQSTASVCSTDIIVDTTNPVAASSLITPADSAGGADVSYDDDTGIFFKWSAATDVGGSGIASYTLKRYDQTACGGVANDTTGLSSATLDQSYTGSTGNTYSFKIVAFDNAGNSVTSACSTDMLIDTTGPVAATVLITPADAAGGVDASYDNDTGIFFKWTGGSDADSGVASYTLKRYDQTACGGAASDTTGISSATTNQSYTGTSGTTYSFKIVTIDNAGNATTSACSTDLMIDTVNPAVATTLLTPADSAGGADASYDDDTGIFVKWTAGSDADSGIQDYTLKVYAESSCGGSAQPDVTGVTGTSHGYTAGGDGTYSFKLVTIDNAGNQSAESACSTDIIVDTTNPVAASSLITPADAAGGVDASYDDDTGVFFKWSAATDTGGSGIASYTLKRYDQAACGGASNDTTGLSSATLNQSYTGTTGNSYSFKIVAYDNSGNSIESGCSTDVMIDTTTPVAANTLETAQDSAGGADASYDDDTGIFFKWVAGSDADSGVASYTLKRYDQAACGGASNDTTGISSGATSQSYTGTTGTTYSFKLVTVDNAGNTTESGCSTDILIDTTAPVAASTLITPADSAGGADASYDDDTGIFFKWTVGSDADSGVASYTLKRYDLAACGGSSTDTTGLSSATTGQSYTGTHGSTYSFKIVIFDNAGNSTESSCSSDMMIDTTAPVAATTLITPADSAGGADASYDNDTGIFFKWTAGSDADSGVATYTLKRYDQAACGGASSDTTGISSATLDQSYTGTNATTYSFEIVTVDNAGNTTTSACSTNMLVDTAVPDTAASNLKTPADSAGGADASYDDDNGIFFAWDAASDAAGGSGIDHYTVHVHSQANCGGGASDVTGISALSHSYTAGSDGTYSFKITAFDAAGNAGTASSCSTNITVDRAAPSAFSITGATITSDNTPTITWGDPGDADKYDVKIASDSGCSTIEEQWLDSTATPGTGVTVASSLNDGLYYICITAKDNAGNTTAASNDNRTLEIETTTVHVSYTTNEAGTYHVRVSDKGTGSWNVSSAMDSTPAGITSIGNRSSLSLDSSNKRHVSVVVTDSSSDDLLYYSTDAGGSFSEEAVDSPGANDMYGYHNTIALDSSDNVYIFNRYLDDGSSIDLLRQSDGTAGSFTNTTKESMAGTSDIKDISTAIDSTDTVFTAFTYDNTSWALKVYDGGSSETPDNLPGFCSDYLAVSMAIDSSDEPHLAYVCFNGTSSCKIYHASRSSSTWTHTEVGTVDGSSCSLGAVTDTYRPSIVLDSSNKAHIAWYDAANSKIIYSENTGGSFTDLDAATSAAGNSSISVDGDGKAYIFYMSGSDLKMTTNNSGAFSAETVDSDVQGVGTSTITGQKGRSNR